jgi:hypothetical protein
MIRIIWITKTGKTTQKQNNAASALGKLYPKLLVEFKISRELPLCLVDEDSWNNKQGLSMHSQSLAHYNTGIRFKAGSRPQEAILLRAAVLNWEDAHVVIPRILRHELVHAKLKGKEKGNEHAVAFHKIAKKYGNVAKKGDY